MTVSDILDMIRKGEISKEELSRLLQSSGNLYAEERILQHSTYSDLNWDKFKSFYEERNVPRNLRKGSFR